ncbi:MAG: hypothetical protein ACHQC8_07925 [Solirubrobacterales bacterium]
MIVNADRAEIARVQADLVSRFRFRPPSDAVLVLAGNGTLLALSLIMFRDDVPGTRLWWWAAVVLATTLARAAWRLMAAQGNMTDAAFLIGMRTVVALQGLSWSIGAAVCMPWMRSQELAIFVAGLAGVIASALNVLAADTPSFRNFTLGITVPLTIGLLASSLGQENVVLAALTLPFGIAMLFVHRQVNRGLAEHIRVVNRLSASEQAQTKLIAELRTALGAVKQLTGLLPICANCKKVRDDSGYWRSVEHYVSEHTDAKFSHGVCPDCFPKLFPDVPVPEPEEQHV